MLSFGQYTNAFNTLEDTSKVSKCIGIQCICIERRVVESDGEQLYAGSSSTESGLSPVLVSPPQGCTHCCPCCTFSRHMASFQSTTMNGISGSSFSIDLLWLTPLTKSESVCHLGSAVFSIIMIRGPAWLREGNYKLLF